MTLKWLFILLFSHFLFPVCLASELILEDYPKETVLFEINSPASVHGRFIGDLQVAVTKRCYCLVSGLASEGIFEASVELSKPRSSFALKLYGRGIDQFEVYHPHGGWMGVQINSDDNSLGWKDIEWKKSKPIGYLRYRVKLSSEDSLFCKLLGPEISPLDSLWTFKTATESLRHTTGTWSGVMGVNLEADYLFLELDSHQRKLLLRQAKNDGFCSIRLHKLTRLVQSLDFNPYFRNTLQNFLHDLSDIGLSLSIDILSWPLETNLKSGQIIENGWKQWIYLSNELQDRTIKLIEWLSSFYLGKSPLFKSKKLIGVCLFNENSLYAEPPKDFIINVKNPCQIMLKVGSMYRRYLRRKGYSGHLFLSNYQLGDEDLLCNLKFSKSIDRHLYFDYPEFNTGNLKVGGRSPLEFLTFWRSRYFELFRGASENWISEINLPWPNQFTHEILPIILALHKEKKISGLWFYDYRLRSSDFHRGGPFGIQRFRSVIEPLGWFKSFLNESYEIKYKNLTLDIQSNQGSVRCFLRGHAIKRVPHCLWKRQYSILLAGPERSLGDQFDPQFLSQIKFGHKAMNIKF